MIYLMRGRPSQPDVEQHTNSSGDSHGHGAPESHAQ
jgi:hypothetical protein